jgi:heme/copper-type cytochrome/quinol oxidase subunit 2
LSASMSFDTAAELLRTRIDSRWGIVWASLLLLLVVSYFFLFFIFYLSSRRKRRNEDKQRQNFPLLSWVEWRTVIQVEELSVRERERWK